MSIYQARFMKYLHNREILETEGRKVWVFMGDGEVDEPESLGAISIAAREKLDNLIFVINCNLQRLDGPVRGNSSIVQELERNFRGAGWNAIKVLWGANWIRCWRAIPPASCASEWKNVDGEYQAFKARGGAFTRENFFGKYPELKEMIADLSDYDIWRLDRGGHDAQKVYAAYAAAVKHKGQPTVILAKTVKGYGMGEAGEGQNITTSRRKWGGSDQGVPRPFQAADPRRGGRQGAVPAGRGQPRDQVHPRAASGPRRLSATTAQQGRTASVPDLSAFDAQLKSSGDREFSTTMAFVRMLTTLLRDKQIGKHVVPIVADEARTFGMEGLFRQLGIYSTEGQLYRPEDAEQLMYYREDKKGQILEEGITEAGALCSWMAAGTSYSNHGISMIPFFIYYSMFGFQRFGDLAWAAGDMQVRGFLMGGTAGRTTLAGEGLQHQDGHSHVFSSVIPNCISYDPTLFIRSGGDYPRRPATDVRRQENIYYVTVMNENYAHPAMSEGVEDGIRKGLYLFRAGSGGEKAKLRVQLLGCGTILREVIAAADLLEADFGVSADIWSVPSFTELREAVDVERWNMLHPEAHPRVGYVAAQLGTRPGPFVAATDYVRTFPDQIGLHLRTLRHARYRGLWAQRHPCQAPEVLRG